MRKIRLLLEPSIWSQASACGVRAPETTRFSKVPQRALPVSPPLHPPTGVPGGGEEGPAASSLCPGAADHLRLGAGLCEGSLQPGPRPPDRPGPDPAASTPLCLLDPQLQLRGGGSQAVLEAPAGETQVPPHTPPPLSWAWAAGEN